MVFDLHTLTEGRRLFLWAIHAFTSSLYLVGIYNTLRKTTQEKSMNPIYLWRIGGWIQNKTFLFTKYAWNSYIWNTVHHVDLTWIYVPVFPTWQRLDTLIIVILTPNPVSAFVKKLSWNKSSQKTCLPITTRKDRSEAAVIDKRQEQQFYPSMLTAAKNSLTIVMQSCRQKQNWETIWRRNVIQNFTNNSPSNNL